MVDVILCQRVGDGTAISGEVCVLRCRICDQEVRVRPRYAEMIPVCIRCLGEGRFEELKDHLPSVG